MGLTTQTATAPRCVSMALIGTGSMGRQYARMLVGGAVPHMRLTTVCCRSGEARAWAGETLPGEVLVCSSSEEVYAHPDRYDAVLIVTPHSSHAELAEQAFALGKHVFCDKPSGMSVGDAEKMNRAAARWDRKFAMMFHQRLYARNRRIKEILDAGELGKLQRAALKSTEPYRTWAYHSSGTWRSSWNGEGGGTLINQGQHPLDLWQWFFGMPQEVYGSIVFGKYNDFAVDDEAHILMRYENGMTGSFFLSTGEARSQDSLEIVGTRGTLVTDRDTITICRYSQDSLEYGKHSGYHTREGMSFEESVEVCPTRKDYEGMLENFAMAVLEGEPLIAPGQEGYKALELANSAYLSAWTRRPVTLPLDVQVYEEELRKRMEEEKMTFPANHKEVLRLYNLREMAQIDYNSGMQKAKSD